jgi:hypothetical protein
MAASRSKIPVYLTLKIVLWWVQDCYSFIIFQIGPKKISKIQGTAKSIFQSIDFFDGYPAIKDFKAIDGKDSKIGDAKDCLLVPR